jgi:toxin-antitoxin system PIN domain toxin
LRYLLDVNVWVALLDEAHVFHAQALAFMERKKLPIATCPLVENGVVRVLNLPGYSTFGPAGFEAVATKLDEICAAVDHEFWPDDLSLRTPGMVNWPRVLGHNQITDIYLLALAVIHDGCFLTLDHRVATSTVAGASARHLLLL